MPLCACLGIGEFLVLVFFGIAAAISWLFGRRRNKAAECACHCCGSDKVEVYLSTTAAMLKARTDGNEAEEDRLLEELDRIWWRLTESERERLAEEMARRFP